MKVTRTHLHRAIDQRGKPLRLYMNHAVLILKNSLDK
jgi:hypothetical protein